MGQSLSKPKHPVDGKVVFLKLQENLEAAREQAAQMPSPEHHDRAVHEFRKSANRCRALLCLLRPLDKPLVKRQQDSLRIMRRHISGQRDYAAMRESFDFLYKSQESRLPKRVWTDARSRLAATAATRSSCDDGKAAAQSSPTNDPIWQDRSREILDELHIIQQNLSQLDPGKLTVSRIIRRLGKSYGQTRQTFMESLRKGTENEAIHQWRKKGKMILYQLQQLDDLDSSNLRNWRLKLEKCNRLLGFRNDLVMIQAHFEENHPSEAFINSSQESGAKGSAASLTTFRPFLQTQIDNLRVEAFIKGSMLYQRQTRTFLAKTLDVHFE